MSFVRTGNHSGRAATNYDLDASDVYFFVATARREDIRAKSSTMRRGSVGALMLDAVAAQYEGRIERSLRSFDRALTTVNTAGRAYVADLVASVLVSRGLFDKYQELRQSVVRESTLEACFLAMDSIVSAREGEFTASVRQAEASEVAVNHVDDEFVRARVLQRVAHAAFERRDYTTAIEKALESARGFIEIGASRSAAASYSIVYNYEHAVSGSMKTANHYAQKMLEAARRSNDVSFIITALVAQYEIAAEIGETSVAESLRTELDQYARPTQYQERFARGIADILLSAAIGEFGAVRANAVLLVASCNGDPAKIALAWALKSLGDAALNDAESARRLSRNALSLATRRGDNSYLSVRYRGLARAIATSTCILINDNVRAQRAAKADVESLALIAVAEGGDYHKADSRLRGYAQAVARAYGSLTQSYRHSPLSAGEYEVLRLLATGLTAPEMATKLNRSVHTVRAQTRMIIKKFGVNGRVAAVAFGRRSGLLRNV